MRAHIRLIIHWCIDVLGVVTLIAIYEDTALRIFVIAVAIPYGLYEMTWLRGVYRVAPTPKEFIAGKPYWKTLTLVYAFSLAGLALGMLTIGESFSRYVGEHLGGFFTVLVAPFAIFVVAHQVAVFRVLRAREV